MAKQGNIKSVRKKEPATVWERNQLGVSLLAECQQLEASRNQQGSCACCHSETKTDVTKGKLLLKRDDSPLPNLTNTHESVFSKRLPQNISNRSHVVELVTPRTTSCCERLPVVLNHCTPVNFSSWTSMNTQLPQMGQSKAQMTCHWLSTRPKASESPPIITSILALFRWGEPAHLESLLAVKTLLQQIRMKEGWWFRAIDGFTHQSCPSG